MTEIEVAANQLSNDELLQLEGRLAVMVEERGLTHSEKVTNLSDRDRDTFLAALDDDESNPTEKLLAAAIEHPVG